MTRCFILYSMEASLPFPDDEAECWFVLRDLKRSNARHPAYRQLAEMGLRVFTPMHEVVTLVRGQRVRKDVPFLRDLLFVRERYSELRSVVERDPTLQFRYVRGGYCTPMTVRTAEMECFIRAVESTFRPRYYLPGEISPSMIGRQVLIVGGPLNGYEGHLLSIRGSRVKRLFIDLPGLLSAGVEVSPEYIRLL